MGELSPTDLAIWMSPPWNTIHDSPSNAILIAVDALSHHDSMICCIQGPYNPYIYDIVSQLRIYPAMSKCNIGKQNHT